MTESGQNHRRAAGALRIGRTLLVVAATGLMLALAGCTSLDAIGAPSSRVASGAPSGDHTVAGDQRPLGMPPLYGSTGPSRTSTAVAGYAVPYPGAPAVKPVEIRMFHPRHKWIALTFDDGWALDPRILLLLEREHIQVTTFIAGRVIETDPAYVLRMQADGFEICDHTFSHRRLPTLSDVDIRLELARAQIDISGITGNQAPYMRPPHGDVDARVERIAASMGYRTVLWTRSLHDTERTTTVEGAYHAAIDGLKPGEIIAAHWDGYVTYEALLRIIPELRRRGFEFVTVSGLLHDSGGPAARR